MSFSVVCIRHELEYSGRRPRLTRLALEIARFPRTASRALDDPRYVEWNLFGHVGEQGYSPRLRDRFIVPLCAALWSTAVSGSGAESGRPRSRARLDVSPFFGLDPSYQWWFSEPGEQIDVRIELTEDGVPSLYTTLTRKRRPLSDATPARALLPYPLLSLQVTALIHFQAARLWLKPLPFFHKPPFVPCEKSMKR